jgi:hypothetical protein
MRVALGAPDASPRFSAELAKLWSNLIEVGRGHEAGTKIRTTGTKNSGTVEESTAPNQIKVQMEVDEDVAHEQDAGRTIEWR